MVAGTVYKFGDCLIWIIPSFFILNHKNYSEIKSPEIFKQLTIFNSSIFCRVLKVIITETIPEEWIGLMVISEDGKEPPFKNVRFGYVDEENGKTESYIGEWKHSSDYQYFRILKFINKRKYNWHEVESSVGRLFKMFNKGYLIATTNIKQNDSLANAYTQTENENAIEADKNGVKHKENSDSVLLNLGSSPCTVQNQDIKDLEKLSQNLKEVFTTGKDSDVTIKVKDREFKAHKVILRARSSVFDKMFSHRFSESNTGVIPIEDCEPDAFEEFMFFIYTGKTQNLPSDNACQLYYIADKYDIPELKEKCVSQLKQSMSTETICDIIYLAAKHKEPELLDLRVKFFARNMEEILLTVKWQVFIQENPIEANELYIKSLKLLKIDFSKIDI